MRKIILTIAITAFTVSFAQETPKKSCCSEQEKKESATKEKKSCCTDKSKKECSTKDKKDSGNKETNNTKDKKSCCATKKAA